MSDKHKKIIAMAKGFRGRSKNCFELAANRVEKSLLWAYVGRKLKKRDTRKLWIQQINAGVRQHDINYSRFIVGLEGARVSLNRKVLADLAATEPYSFKAVVEVAKLNVPKKAQLIPPKEVLA